MNQLYLYNPDVNHWDSYNLDPDISDEVIDLHFRAERVGQSWKRYTLKALTNDVGKTPDFPGLCNYGQIPIVSPLAWQVLKPIIGESVEALPIDSPVGELFVLNVLELVDCLDEDRSELTRNHVSNRVNRVYKHAFKHDLIRDKHIFKTPLKSGADLFVDEVFRETVAANGLQGLKFVPLELLEEVE